MNIKLIEWVLRISVAGEFLGHGIFALQGKKDWIGWFANFGISDQGVATQLLFIVGIMDIVLAILILIKPVRIALLGFRRAFRQLGSAPRASTSPGLAKKLERLAKL